MVGFPIEQNRFPSRGIPNHELLTQSLSTTSTDEAFTIEIEGVTGSSFVLLVEKPKEDAAILLPLVIGSLGMFTLLLIFYVLHRRRRWKLEATAWIVAPSDLEYSSPPTVLGRGSFGLVLLANYRGTEVAVKRVLPPQSSTAFDIGTVSEQAFTLKKERGVMSARSRGSRSVDSTSFTGTGGSGGKLKALKAKFMEEMSHLAKLRHPNITTVMGAVLEGPDPLLVMEYLNHGSLFDLLQNRTVRLYGLQISQVLRGVCKGMRFLHEGGVVHGDLKSANILVDSHFQGKVADFGLTQKKALGAVGTPVRCRRLFVLL